MSNQIKPNFQVNPFFLFFLIHSAQLGIGILTFQRMLVKEAGYDSWISVLLAGLMAHLSLFFIFRMLKYEHQDISDIHQFVYGKWLGKCFTLIITIQFIWTGLTVLHAYIRIIQIWMFPKLPTWFPTLLILVLAYYTITGGFRVIVGMCFFKIILAFIITLPMFFTLVYAQWRNLSLIPVHTMTELWNATKGITFNYAGMTTILVYYPFIKEGQKSKKYAYLGNAATTFLYLIVTLMCFMFYSEKQLKITIWPFLVMTKTVSFTIIERFDLVFVAAWLLVVVPIVIQNLWCSSRLAKQVFKVKQKYPLILFMIIYVIVSHFVDDGQEVRALYEWNAKFAFYVSYAYIFILFLEYMLIRRIKSWSQPS
ncbi:MAG TPA: GerAB/ArcD/ProY family transporter [Bacillus sp. (in: firmicutes)]|nr:GerAB/ArcD/ProY family transporter [Bacillus sp. (in: firmicutes)]